MERQISLTDILQAAGDTARASMYFRWPGVVVAYHASTQTADVQPTLSDARLDVTSGGIVIEPWPVILGVRVAWPRFGGFTISGPLAPNDPVVLEAFDLDPSPALAGGRSTKPANPVDVRRHGGNYWLCRPTDLTGPIGDASAAGSHFILGKDGDPSQVRFAAGSVQVGLAGATITLGGGGAAVGRVGDAVSVTLTTADALEFVSPSGGGGCVLSAPLTLTGMITGGSSKVTSG
jgi:hypothetical protein